MSRSAVLLSALFLNWFMGTGFAHAQAPAQTELPLNDLTAFRSPVGAAITANWRIVGDAMADFTQKDAFTTTMGTGVLANVPAKPEFGRKFDIMTVVEHGDMDLELDYMLAKGSNSGVYLQGRYELQLFDSWGVKALSVHDNGAIYERWDDTKPDGRKGYEGTAARQNVSRAPGLWQHLKIAFQAPRFDASGQKIANARMLRVELNGVLIHENVELTGPTRGPLAENEVPRGPLLLQGDHGPVAFRNIRYVLYDKTRPQLSNLTYMVYKGKYDKQPDFGKTPPEAKGPSPELTSSVSRNATQFLIRYTGTLHVNESGKYNFRLGTPGGAGTLTVNNQPIVVRTSRNQMGTAMLPAGDLPFELVYAKDVEWDKPNLSLIVNGPGVREFALTNPEAEGFEETDPILVDATTQPILRSFMDIPGRSADAVDADKKPKSFRVVHAISVGSSDQVHYTYDMDKGALVQVWRGMFLDATPMWNDRGDGSSRPMGMVQYLGVPELVLEKLASPQAVWQSDTVGTGYRPKGYVLDDNDRPTFKYRLTGVSVEDAIRVMDNGQGIRRDITLTGPSTDLYARLAEGTRIEQMPNGVYAVDAKSYYVRINDASGAIPVVRTVKGRQELVVPVKDKISYSILF